LKIDQNPTPKDEARDFENPDERMRDKVNAHELALLTARRGLVGKLTGSTNEALNTGLMVLIVSLILFGFAMLGTYINASGFNTITDDLFKLVLTVAGYVFGTHTANK
ncbi:MAG: hypothetical protein ACRECU_12975, partial [Methylocella sp.]